MVRKFGCLCLYGFSFCYYVLHSFARDTIGVKDLITDGGNETLVSAGKRFELGFFTPNGSSVFRRYVGIWYYNSHPKTVVWVANRDNPVLDSGGVFGIGEDGNLKLVDGSGKCCWETNLEKVSAISIALKLMDTGNLVLSEGNQSLRILWQSFSNPTDTFLPGMKMEDGLTLSSWKNQEDPEPGNFTFQQDQEGVSQFTVWKRSIRYWKSGVSGELIGTGQIPSAIYYLLSNFTSSIYNDSVPYITSSLFRDTRLVLSFSGQIQYLKWNTEKVWSLVWAAPRDRCSVYNACGDFGCCNSEHYLACKCLPGFVPISPENWNAGDFSGGCSRESMLCSENSDSDIFISLKMMKVRNPDSQFMAKNEMECTNECLNNCQCQGYSFQAAEATVRSAGIGGGCSIWTEDLNNLQEGYDAGQNLSVRIAVSSIESTSRNCEPCGTNLIPYPLSTSPGCGDPLYFNFQCNTSTGQVFFRTPGGNFQVTSINQETRKFTIQTGDEDNCQASKGKLQQLDQTRPFHVTSWCNADSPDYGSGLPLEGGKEIEIGWEPPREPTCSSLIDCKDWPDSTCNATGNGQKRCICNPKFHWDDSNLNCTREGHLQRILKNRVSLPQIISVTFASVIAMTLVSFTILYLCSWRNKLFKRHESRRDIQLYDSDKRFKDLIDSGSFKEDDTKGLDVPFFDLETILDATNNLSSSNKLGQGGFGPVYKGMFPGGQEIAVKRLSRGSGQGVEEFKNEVVLIAKLQHRNLVRLLGYCVKGEEKMLLYEYMPNKSLDFFIFDQKLCSRLDWEMRFKIILGIARGLLYLHQDSRLRIIHRDLKTSNILLDEEMNPKISDFGLARIFGGKETAANTNRVVGTYGYMSPEYALDGLFSFKSDVFSFGVVVIEILSGKRNTGFFQSEQGLSLLGYAWSLWKQEKAVDLMDKTVRETCNENEYLKCVNVGLLCVQEDPSDRPTMSNVVFMLGSDAATLPNPKQPAFIARRCNSSTASSCSKPDTFSHNDLTITVENGR